MKPIFTLAFALSAALLATGCAGTDTVRPDRNFDGCIHPSHKLGFLTSPYGQNPVLDIRGLARGTKIQDPFTGGIILIPLDPEDTSGIPIPNDPPKKRQRR
jgi:hypothetical protein